MPAIRTQNLSLPAGIEYATRKQVSLPFDAADVDMYYPTTSVLRYAEISSRVLWPIRLTVSLLQRVTPHQWAVYDFARTIPVGKVVTYKDVCQAVGGSPRSVGGALRTNPFAPFVPCHRVIASSLFIGGFLGEWGKEHRTGTQCDRKLGLLSKEGVTFTGEGYLKAEDGLWKGDVL
ncbi:6-O-methylguanine DNA methyltransferase [Mycena alexandri]|uniref:Methylated-DNA--protein-cysteine methyltransferase n=1 Tax=Mycena alexandri TaxID=1745969 RepID=A0AAD6SPS1_9AGAR|nr:6-O-methylguanine DNA methyltransferase [Mycena alexandri]